MRYLCIAHDLEDTYRITGFDTKKDNEVFDESRYVEVDADSFTKLIELSKSNTITYPKGLKDFDMSKIVLNEEDPLQIYKYSCRVKAMTSFKEKLAELDMFLFLKYFTLSMELSDKGYFMHKGNVESILDRLKTEQKDQLLLKAESLADVIKDIELNVCKYDSLVSTLKKINSSSKKDEITEILEDYLRCL